MSHPSQLSARVDIRGLSFRYHETLVVDDVSLIFEAGSICCLLGPSGCGKTTLLRLLAGFEKPASGEIAIDDATVSDAHHVVPPEQRNIGMVFQDFALFPHLHVAGNITFALNRWTPAERQNRLEELLALTGLQGLEHRYPHQISGGQQQRVALARAIAPRPRLVLLDEPFASLDIALRTRIAEEVRAILKREGMTAVLVTHDQNEAFAFSDHTAVMHHGRIEQFATAAELYHRPTTRFVAGFVGEGVWVGATIEHDHAATAFGKLKLHPSVHAVHGAKIDVLLRPEHVEVRLDSASPHTVINHTFRGNRILLTIALANGTTVLAFVPSNAAAPIGARVSLHCADAQSCVFPTR